MRSTIVPMWNVQPQQQNQTGPSGSGSGGDIGGGQQGGDGGQAGGGGDQTGSDGGQGGEERSPKDAPNDKGFPVDTPVAKMSEKEAAAYWRFQSRKFQAQAQAAPSATELAELRQFKANADLAAMNETDRKVEEARRSGAAQASDSALTKSATAIYKAGLSARGIEGDALAALVRGFNSVAYLTGEGEARDIDTDGVSALAALHAGPGTGTHQQQGWPDMGNGRRQSSQVSAREAGRAEAQRRYPSTAAK